MSSRIPIVSLVLLVLTLTSCAVAPAGGEQWRIRVTGADGAAVGELLVEMTGETASGPCLSSQELKVARVVDKSGFAHDPVGETIGMRVDGGTFIADLTKGICDASLALSGPLRDGHAEGNAERSTIAGPSPAGSFTADRVRR